MALSWSGLSPETTSLEAVVPQTCRKRLRGRLSHRPLRLNVCCCLLLSLLPACEIQHFPHACTQQIPHDCMQHSSPAPLPTYPASLMLNLRGAVDYQSTTSLSVLLLR